MVLLLSFCDVYKQSGNHPTPWVNLIPLWITELRLVHSGFLICSSALTWHAQSQSRRHQVWNELEPLLAFFGPHPGRFHLLPWVVNPPMEKHQLSWNKARMWALFNSMCTAAHAFTLGIVMLLIAWDRSNYLTWERLFPGSASSPMETCFRRREEVLGPCYCIFLKASEMRLLVFIYSVTTKV